MCVCFSLQIFIFTCFTKVRRNTSSSEDELSVPMRRIKPQRKVQSNPPPSESTTLNKPPRAQKGPLVMALSSNSGHGVKQKASRPQRASLRKQQSGGVENTMGSESEMTENTKAESGNGHFLPRDGAMSYDEQETRFENDPKTKHNNKYSQKQIQDEPQSMPHDSSSLRRSARIYSKTQYSTDSNSSFASPDPPKSQRGKGSTDHKPLTKPLNTETSLVKNSTSHKEQNEEDSVRRSRRPKKTSQRNSDVLVGDSIDLPTDDDDEESRRHNKKHARTLLLKRTRQRKAKSELKTNGHLASSEDMHSEHSEDEESVQHAVSNNRRSKKSETGKANTRSKKPQTENSHMNEQDELLDGKWTEEELQKLHE